MQPIPTPAQHHTIAIIGGTGFVGQHLTARLTAAGHRVRLITRRAERHRQLQLLGSVTLQEPTRYDAAGFAAALHGCDVAINLVGILNERGHDGSGFRAAHLELSEQLVAGCQQAGITRLLQMSALGADAERGSSHYQRTKGAAEDAVHAASGINVTSFRPSIIFGPGDSFFNRFAALLRLLPGPLPLAGAHTRFAPVYVGDVVHCFAAAIDDRTTFGQRYNLCGPQRYTLAELIAWTARTIGLSKRIIPLPHWAGQLQANLFEYLPGKVLSRDNFASLQQDNLCDAPFPPQFGITPQSIDAVVPWYLAAQSERARLMRLRADSAGRDR